MTVFMIIRTSRSSLIVQLRFPEECSGLIISELVEVDLDLFNHIHIHIQNDSMDVLSEVDHDRWWMIMMDDTDDSLSRWLIH